MTKTIEQEALDLNALAAKAWEDGQMAFDAATSPLTNPFPCRDQGAAAAIAAIAAVIAPELERRDREIERLREALERIGIYGCGMLSQPAALNAPREVWLDQRIFEMERTARAALGASHDADA